MDGRNWIFSSLGDPRILVGIGAAEVALAALRILHAGSGNPISDVVATDLLIVVPGLALVYGGYRLPESDLHPEVYPVIVARCLAGIGAMLAVVGLLAVSTGLNRPMFTPIAGAALGSAAGFAIGLNEARALSRAHEAERHREDLREERDLREQVFETSPVGIVVVDADGSVRMANERAARITGRSEAELLDLDHYNHPSFGATDGEGDPVDGGVVETVLNTGEPRFDVERRITRADGQRIWLSVNGAPLGSGADPDAVVLAFEDVTERKQLERELRETVDRLEESNERLEQFAYAASHDLQEPLRMVSSYLQLLENRYGEDLDDEANEYIGFAVDGADRMRTMIESLLEYSRVSARGAPFEPTDANEVLESVLDDLRLRIEETDATVTSDDLPTVPADADQLAQVFQNLLSNALEYSGDEPPRVHVSAERIDEGWRFSVTDEGIGIDPEYHDRIFTIFNQLHADEGDASAGGIGLALCERIVERHGGDLWVESEPGEGATFYFTVPESAEQPAEDATSSPSIE